MNVYCKRMIVIAALILAGCASRGQAVTGPSSSIGSEFEVAVADNFQLRRFDIRVVSHSDRKLCIAKDAWPDDNGRFSDSTLEVHVLIPNRKIDLKPALMSVYCPGGCGQVTISPRATLVGFISYEAFQDVEAIVTANERKLQFSANVYACR